MTNPRGFTSQTSQGAIVAVLAFAGLCSTFMFTLVIPIQSRLPELLDADRDATAWVVTITVLAAAIATPIAGRLGDLFGKRRIILVLVAVMAGGSVLAAVSSNLAGMIVGRGLQGAMAGTIPLGIAIMGDVLQPRRLAPAIALMSATLGIGGALGLPVSALLTQYAHWRMLFWVSALLGLLVLLLLLFIVPVSTLRASGRFDLLGALGLAIGLAGILLAISRGAAWGWGSGATIGSATFGVAVLLSWGWYQLRTSHPLLDLRVAARPPVLLTNLTSFALGFGMFSANIIFPQLLELPMGAGAGFGLSLFTASLVVMPSGLVVLLLSPIAGRLAMLIGPKPLLVAGCAAVLVAYSFTFLLHHEVWHLVVANVLVGVGIAFSFASVPLLIMRSVPHDETGASNGLNALFRAAGTTVAAAAIGAVLAAFTLDDGTGHPAPVAFQIAFAMAVLASSVALVFSLFVPSQPESQEQLPALPSQAHAA